MENSPTLLIYGATGYTGKLIAQHAVKEGLRPILAGRSERVKVLAAELNCEARQFALDDPGQIRAGLQGVAATLNCAGPFEETAPAMIDACLTSGVHYLDITGEIGVLEHAAGLHDRAAQAGIVLMPAVGFDVVPTDCLAGMLAARLPEAVKLELVISNLKQISPGTMKTMLRAMPQGGRVRREGEIVSVPVAHEVIEITLRDGRNRHAMAIPWGDVASAYHTTGIPNITTYVIEGHSRILVVQYTRWLLPALRAPGARSLVEWLIDKLVQGPTEKQRDQTMELWGRVTDRQGRSVVGHLTVLSGYALTVLTALDAARRVAAGQVAVGYQTPCAAFGPEYILNFPRSLVTFDDAAS